MSEHEAKLTIYGWQAVPRRGWMNASEWTHTTIKGRISIDTLGGWVHWNRGDLVGRGSDVVSLTHHLVLAKMRDKGGK